MDSFGHNSVNTHIVSQIGFDSLAGRMLHDYLNLQDLEDNVKSVMQKFISYLYEILKEIKYKII